MKLASFKPIFSSFVVSLILFLIHKLIFKLLCPIEFINGMVYSVQELYVLFFLFTAVILFILLLINQKGVDNVGFTYLFLTGGKMLIAYLLMQPILNAKNAFAFSEKINFFVIFILFLIIETVLTIRMLNNKQ